MCPFYNTLTGLKSQQKDCSSVGGPGAFIAAAMYHLPNISWFYPELCMPVYNIYIKRGDSLPIAKSIILCVEEQKLGTKVPQVC